MWEDLVKLQKDDLYAIHEIGDAKFLKLFGFEFLEDFVGADNKPRQTYVRRALWALKQQSLVEVL